MPELIKKGNSNYLNIDGFLYYKHSPSGSNLRDMQNVRIYWKCNKKKQCSATAIVIVNGATINVCKGGDPESHNQAPNREEVESLKLLAEMRREATDNPEAPPSRIMRKIQEAPPAVLAELSDRQNIKRQIQRERVKDMPTNPQNIEDLLEVQEKYKKNHCRRKLFDLRFI